MLYRSEGLWPSPKHEDKIAKIAKRAGKKPVRALGHGTRVSAKAPTRVDSYAWDPSKR